MEVVERVIKLYLGGELKGYRVVFGDIAYDIYRDSFDSYATVEYICVDCLKKDLEKQNLLVDGVHLKTNEELSGSFNKSIWDVTNDIKGIKLLHRKLKLCLDSNTLKKEREWRYSSNLLHYFVDNVGYKKGIYIRRGTNGITIRKMLDSNNYMEYVLTPKYLGYMLVGIDLECSKVLYSSIKTPYVGCLNGSYVVDNNSEYYKSDLRRCRLMRLNIRSNNHYTLKNTDKLVVGKYGITYRHKVSIKLAYSNKECLGYLIDNFNI